MTGVGREFVVAGALLAFTAVVLGLDLLALGHHAK